VTLYNGFNSSRFSRYRPDFEGLKEVCRGVTQNSVLDAKFSWVLPSHSTVRSESRCALRSVSKLLLKYAVVSLYSVVNPLAPEFFFKF
jgi:hypothetical protein